MKKFSSISIIFIAIFILCFALTGCGNNNKVKEITAESFTISYGKSIYTAKDKVDQDTIDSLVKKYNDIKLVGTTKQEINYDEAITIIFINNDQISGQVTVDDQGICRIEERLDNYSISKESNLYLDALNVYHDLQKNYES